MKVETSIKAGPSVDGDGPKVWGAEGNENWERTHPQCRSRSEFYDDLRQEIKPVKGTRP